jgi:hypothetical protein
LVILKLLLVESLEGGVRAKMIRRFVGKSWVFADPCVDLLKGS